MDAAPTSEEKPVSRGPLGATIAWISAFCLVLSFGYFGVALFAVCMFSINYGNSGGYLGSVIGTASIHVANSCVLAIASAIGITSGVVRNKALQKHFSWATVCMFMYICLVCGVLFIVDAITYYYMYNIILSGVVLCCAAGLLLPSSLVAITRLVLLKKLDPQTTDSAPGSTVKVIIVPESNKITPIQFILVILSMLLALTCVAYCGVSIWLTVTTASKYRDKFEQIDPRTFHANVDFAVMLVHLLNSITLFLSSIVGITAVLIHGAARRLQLNYLFMFALGANMIVFCINKLISALNVDNKYIVFSSTSFGVGVIFFLVLEILAFANTRQLNKLLRDSVSIAFT